MIKLKSLVEKLKVGDPSNWHGTEETQREYVIRIAQEKYGGIDLEKQITFL